MEFSRRVTLLDLPMGAGEWGQLRSWQQQGRMSSLWIFVSRRSAGPSRCAGTRRRLRYWQHAVGTRSHKIFVSGPCAEVKGKARLAIPGEESLIGLAWRYAPVDPKARRRAATVSHLAAPKDVLLEQRMDAVNQGQWHALRRPVTHEPGGKRQEPRRRMAEKKGTARGGNA